MSRLDVKLLTLLVLMTLVLWLPRFRGPIDLRWDAGVYFTLGTSLAEGQGYRLLNEPGEIEAVQYPPLLPAIVAAHQKVLGTSSPLVVGRFLRIFFFLVTVGNTVAVYVLARRYLSPIYSFVATIIASCFIMYVYLSDLCFTESPYTLASLIFMLAYPRSSERPGMWGLTALMGVAAYLFRTSGIALLGAWIVDAVIHRQFKQAALRTAVTLLPVLGWQMYISGVVNSPQYTEPAYAYQRAPYQYYNVTYLENILLIDPFAPELGKVTPRDLVLRIVGNLPEIPTSLGETVSTTFGMWLWAIEELNWRADAQIPLSWVVVPLLVFGSMVLVGASLMILRDQWIIPLYIGASIALICLTPWPKQFSRYLTPLTPFFALTFVYCAYRLRDGLERWLGRPGKWTGLAFVAAVTLVATSVEAASLFRTYYAQHDRVYYRGRGDSQMYHLFYYSGAWKEFDRSLEWLMDHADPAGVVASSSPHHVYLRTGMKAVMPPLEENEEVVQELLDSVPVRYVVTGDMEFTDSMRKYIVPTIQSRPALWKLVYEAKHSELKIYERIDAPTATTTMATTAPSN